MKRSPVFSILSLALLIVLFSCEKETILSVDQSSFEISDAGGSQTVSLTANKPWSASSNQSWCKVSPSAGEEASNSRITITCDPNTTYDARNCTVTFTCAELTKTVSISQATNNGLLVSQTSYELTKVAQQLEIQVQANVKFSVEVDNGCKDWITYKTTKGLTTNTVVLDIAENKSYDRREGLVTIKQDGGNLSSTITIKQSQLDGLFISTPEYNLSNEKHTLTVEVSTNVEFEVIPGAEWVKHIQTKGLNSKQIILEVAENDTYDPRETKVNVKQKNGDLSGVITIKQDENYGILVTQSEYILSNEEQAIDVEVKYNVDFDVVIPDECKDWVSVVGTKGLSSRTYTFSIAKNESYVDREGSITFKQKDGPASGSIHINQAQTDYLSVESDSFTISKEAQTLRIKVESNIKYDIEVEESSQSWISKTGTKSINESYINLSISKNEGDVREGKIIIQGHNVVVRVSINQEGIYPIVYYTSTDGQLVWPNSVEGVISDKLEVISNTYENGMGRLVLCDTVTVLPKRAFALCNSLVSVKIPSGIVEIGIAAFASCINLKSVELPQSITAIGPGAFNICENLKEITLPEGIKTLDSYVFAGCYNLERINIPTSVSYIKDRAFMMCHELKEITIPNSVTFIGIQAFYECLSLKSINIPGSVKTIESNAFWGCNNVEDIQLNEGIEYFSLNSGVFENCTKLKSIIIPGSIKELGYESFKGCTSLQSVIIKDGVTMIGNGVFADCILLSDVIIPETVTDIGNAFLNCSGLQSIKLPAHLNSLLGSFSGCSQLREIVVPSGITELNGTFSWCTSLTKVVLPNTLNNIIGAFKECTSLTSIALPEGIKKIGYQSFKDCYNLKSIDLPEGLTDIVYYAFENCSSLESITIPSTVTSIGEWAFWGCGNLLTIILLPQRPPYLGRFPFSTLKDVYVPKGCLELYLADSNWMTWVGDCLQEMPD